jgi:hypothetical protein
VSSTDTGGRNLRESDQGRERIMQRDGERGMVSCPALTWEGAVERIRSEEGERRVQTGM